MKNKHWLEGIQKETASLIEDYIDQGGPAIPQASVPSFPARDMTCFARHMADSGLAGQEARLGTTLLFSLAVHSGNFYFLREFANKVEDGALSIASDMDSPPPPAVLSKAICETSRWEMKMADPGTAQQPFESAFLNFVWNHMDWSAPILVRPGWIRALARWYPEQLTAALSQQPNALTNIIPELGREIIEETELADEMIAGWATLHLTSPPAPRTGWSSAYSDRCKAFFVICQLHDLRKGRYHDLVMRLVVLPEFASSHHAVDMLLRYSPDTVLETVTAGIGDDTRDCFTESYRKLVLLALAHIRQAGEPLLRKMLAHYDFQYGWVDKVNAILLADPARPHTDIIRKIYLDHASELSGKKLADFWAVLAKHDQGLFLKEWQAFAEGKSKMLRETAAAWLLAHRPGDAMEKIERLIASPSTEERLAAISLLEQITSGETTERLKSMHTSEPTKQVRLAIAAVLAKRGVPVAPEPDKEVQSVEDIGAFEAMLVKKAKSIRLPKAAWLKPDALPPLKTMDGRELSLLATTYVFQCQARGRAGIIEPEIALLLPHLSRPDNAAFAHSLLDQWFASDMKASTRWALDVAGITGDDTIIGRLIEPIPEWCGHNHGSRAEWAAHAIALLGSEKALGTLDGLIQRYRTQRKYVGAAASLAIFRTAEMLGISPDELSERIVPDFGFNETGERAFATRKGHATAVLCHDFKLAWKDDSTGELAAHPTDKLTEESEAELKETRKLLKEAVTRQTLRLTDAMICGRKWPMNVWRGRFETHPLFRIVAMRIVWGIHDADGNLLRTFRLYPNGLTANAVGELEEFPESDATIGIPHRMALDDKTTKEWCAHLKRFKVKPLFSQLDRHIHQLDPLHANRQHFPFTANVKSHAGGVRKEMLGRGWALSAAGDGGYLHGVWRRFPGSDVEAFLPIFEMHASSTQGETVTLGEAYFARGNSKKSNYSEFPSPAIPFGDVPAILYSETFADLTALISTSK